MTRGSSARVKSALFTVVCLSTALVISLGMNRASAAGPATEVLAVSRSGLGSGTVTSTPAGISCGSKCKNTFVVGSNITLTAQADFGSRFAGWVGGGCSGRGPCTITLTTYTTITAVFSFATSNVTATCHPNKTCRASAHVAGSTHSPEEDFVVTGKAPTNDAAVKVAFGLASFQCPGSAPEEITARAKLNSSGFAPKASMRVTLTLRRTASTKLQICYHSKSPFKSRTKTTAVNGGAGMLLGCAQVASKPPCVVSIAEVVGSGGQDIQTVLVIPDPPPQQADGDSDEVGAAREPLDGVQAWAPASTTGHVNSLYQTTTLTHSGGQSPFTWSAARIDTPAANNCPAPAKWPASMQFALDTGTISGTPTRVQTCKVTITITDSAHQSDGIDLTFTVLPPRLTVRKSGLGTGTVTSAPAGISCGSTCAKSFPVDTSITLTAQPASGSTFGGWTGCTASTTKPRTCTFTLHRDKGVTAQFNR